MVWIAGMLWIILLLIIANVAAAIAVGCVLIICKILKKAIRAWICIVAGVGVFALAAVLYIIITSVLAQTPMPIY